MSGVLSSIFFFLIALGLLIAIHEFGHYWVARRLGVKVLKFSIGFGKPLWKTTRGADNTEYALAAIPLGGYVRMLDEREGEVAPHELHRAFNRQPVGKRFAIVVAGADEATPGWQNVALTIIEKTLDEDRVPVEVKDVQGERHVRMLRLTDVQKKLERGNLLETLGIEPARPALPPVIGSLEAGGAGAAAGMKAGDRVVAIDGEPVDDWEDWVAYVRAHPEQVIRTEVVRGCEHLVFNITPKLRATKEGDIGYVGAAVAVPKAKDAEHELTAVVRYSPLAAVGEAMAKTWHMSVLTLRMLWGMVAGEVSVSNISGPISIAQYAGYSAQGGIVSFLTFIAIVSISLGVLNLLPVPVLDGGHLLYYIIEWIKGSPVSDSVQAFCQRIGVTALLLLMVVAVYNDVVHLFKFFFSNGVRSYDTSYICGHAHVGYRAAACLRLRRLSHPGHPGGGPATHRGGHGVQLSAGQCRR